LTAMVDGISKVTNPSNPEASISVTVMPQVPKFTVIYDGNGSTGITVPTDSGAYTQSVTVTVLMNSGTLVKADHIFAGWNTQAKIQC
jgi:hypothetical protein